MIIGTAGHVDHGKTVLIKAFTGVDTDRLREEKERGISIDLGIAPFLLPGGRLAGPPGQHHAGRKTRPRSYRVSTRIEQLVRHFVR